MKNYKPLDFYAVTDRLFYENDEEYADPSGRCLIMNLSKPFII